jgi:hypothetical protein
VFKGTILGIQDFYHYDACGICMKKKESNICDGCKRETTTKASFRVYLKIKKKPQINNIMKLKLASP